MVGAMQKKVFISSSSKDAKVAQAICSALEARGHGCWTSGRDVPPGENYQGAIVRAITNAGAMVMVFSTNANNSEEIKKELALASQSHLMVVPVRAEDVLPSEDFRYELATRQWIDLFEDWERSIEQLGCKIDSIIPRAIEPWPACAMEMMETHAKPTPSPFKPKPGARRDKNPLPLIVMGTIGVLALVVAGSFWLMRPPPPPTAVPEGMMLMPQADMHPSEPHMDPAQLDEDLWDSVKDSGDLAALTSYLAKFPGGIFSAAAKARIEALNKPSAPAAHPVTHAATATPVAPPHTMAMPMAMPVPHGADGGLNSNVQMAVAMARSAEIRAREMAGHAEEVLRLAQAGTSGYGTQTLHATAQWNGRLAIFQSNSPAVVTYGNGDRYAGGTRRGMRDGVGIFTGNPARVYRERVGEFVTDELEGYGVVYRRDGRVRAGQWKGGRAEGYGAVYDAQGHLAEQGLYAGDKLAAPLTHN
jgi:hypothetical protein